MLSENYEEHGVRAFEDLLIHLDPTQKYMDVLLLFQLPELSIAMD